MFPHFDGNYFFSDSSWIISHTFLHCAASPPIPEFCFPAEWSQLRDESVPPCLPHVTSVPSSATGRDMIMLGNHTQNCYRSLCVHVHLCICTCLSSALLSISRSCLAERSCISSERSWSTWEEQVKRGGSVTKQLWSDTPFHRHVSSVFACVFKYLYMAMFLVPGLCCVWCGHSEVPRCSSPHPARSPVPLFYPVNTIHT